MITWMQKHKKYLIITIWISTIAFVGAGSVAWGTLDFNSNRAGSVAKVGDVLITNQKFNIAYNNILQYYSNLAGKEITNEEAENMGLESIVLNSLIQESLLLNYAKDLGLRVSNNEISKAILENKSFQTNGQFDQAQYQKTLKMLRMTPNDYEKNLKDQILLEKILNAIKLNANDFDKEIFQSVFFMRDKIEAQVISVDADKMKADEKALKELWENTKNNYLTTTKYNLEVKFIPASKQSVEDSVLEDYYADNKDLYRGEDDKILDFAQAKNAVKKDYLLHLTKLQATKEYKDVRKSELKLTQKMLISQDDPNFPTEFIIGSKKGDVIKPFLYNDGYLIARVADILNPEPMSYENARAMVLKQYQQNLANQKLEELSKEALESKFAPKFTGYISKETQKPILGLNATEFNDFIDKLFKSKNKKGYFILGDKSIVYNILEQDLLDSSATGRYDELIVQNATAVKNEELQRDLLEILKNKYEYKQYKGIISGD